MRYTIMTLSLLTLLVSPARAEDEHPHQAAHGHRHVVGKVTAVEKDRIEVATDEGTKTVVLPEDSANKGAREAAKSDTPLQKGEDVTVHGEMTASGDFEAHEIYRGRCGQRAEHCQQKDLAWSHTNAMRGGPRMGHGMMKKHMQGGE